MVVVRSMGMAICTGVHEWSRHSDLLKSSDKKPVSTLRMTQIIPMYKIMINIQMLLLNVNMVACYLKQLFPLLNYFLKLSFVSVIALYGEVESPVEESQRV